MKTTFLIILLSVTFCTGAMAQPDSRLVGTSIYSYRQTGLLLVDSTAMNYSGSRAYDPKLEQWLFDSSRSFDENYDEVYRNANSYDANNRLIQTLYHTFDGGWMIGAYARYEYTPGGLPAAKVESRFDGMTWDSVRTICTYNAPGDLLTEVDESYDFIAKAWTSTNRTIRTYTAAGKVDTLWNGYYHKNTGLWKDNYRTIYQYNNSQQLVKHTTEEFDGTNWNNYGYAVYTYNAAGKPDVVLHRNWTGAAFADLTRFTYTYIGDDVETLTLENNLNGILIKTQQRSYLYNSHHQPIQEDVKSWDPVLMQFVFKDFNNRLLFYYKDFATGIGTQTINTDGMRVYPVPASNELNLDVNMSTPQIATVMLFDMTGRMVQQMNLPAVKHYSQRIDVSSLPAGSYRVLLNAGGTNLMQQISVVK